MTPRQALAAFPSLFQPARAGQGRVGFVALHAAYKLS